jgi:hypothetical protein
LSIIGKVDDSEINQLISTWVRHNTVKVCLGLIYGLFAIASNLIIFEGIFWYALVIGVFESVLITFVLICDLPSGPSASGVRV